MIVSVTVIVTVIVRVIVLVVIIVIVSVVIFLRGEVIVLVTVRMVWVWACRFGWCVWKVWS